MGRFGLETDEGGGEEGRKQTAFPGNSQPKEEEKRVGNRLPFRGIRNRRRRRRGQETDCLSGEFATEGGGEEGRKQAGFPGEFATEGGGEEVGNRLPFLGICYRRRRRRGLETGCLSGEFATEVGGDQDWKQTAFPGNSLPNEEGKRVGNRLPFRGTRRRRMGRFGLETDCLSGGVRHRRKRRRGQETDCLSGNSLPKEEEKRVINRLPFRGIGHRRMGRFGLEIDCLSGGVRHRRKRRRGQETDCLSGNSLPKEEEKRVGNSLPLPGNSLRRRSRRGSETDCLSGGIRHRGGGEEAEKQTVFPSFRGIRYRKRGRLGLKLTAFPGNSLNKEGEIRVGNTLRIRTVPLTNGSISGRPKSLRIRNTVQQGS